MTGMCGHCELPIWEMPEDSLSLVPDQPKDTPPEELLVGGLVFCSHEHLNLFCDTKAYLTTGMRVVPWLSD